MSRVGPTPMVLSVVLKQNPEFKKYDSNDFHIVGIFLNAISLVIYSIKIIIQLIELWIKMDKRKDKSFVGKMLACTEIMMFLLVYIGNIVILVFYAIFLYIRVDQDNTLLIISCVLFAIICLIQSVLLLIMFVYPLGKGLM